MSKSTTKPATESHTIKVDTCGGHEISVSFTAPHYIEADLGEQILNGRIDDDPFNTYDFSVHMETYLGTEITYSVTYEITEWEVLDYETNEEVPLAAVATITHD